MPGKTFRFGDYEADLAARELRKQGTRIGLQHKPFHVLERLLRNPGQLVTRQELFDYLWPDSHVSFERGLNSAVNSLRHVLGETSRQCHYIETRPGLGYRFIAAVHEVNAASPCEAYEDCLKGRYLLDRMTDDETHKALAYFHSAACEPSHSAQAHSGIADAYCQLALLGSVPASQVCHLAASSAEQALLLNPQLPEAHIASARVKLLFHRNLKGSRESLLKALELDSNSTAAYTLLASLDRALGEWEPALESCARALKIDPLSFPANLQMAACLLAAGDLHGSVNQCWKMLSLQPNFAPAHLSLACACQQLNMHEEAIVEFENAKLCPACIVPATAGLSHARREKESEQAFNDLLELGKTRHVSPYWHALIHTARNQYDLALSFLHHAAEQNDPALLWLRSDVRFQPLAASSRFQALLP
jgi:DNA-binding winged helix-turn-helix (wHTH) protein